MLQHKPDPARLPKAGVTKLRVSEIVAIALALVLPAAVLVLIFTPGAFGAVMFFIVTNKAGLWVVCGSLALVVAILLAFRIMARLRKRDPSRPASFWDLWRDPNR